LTTRDESIARVMHPLFQAGEGGSLPTSSLDLWFSTIDLDRAKELNTLWHRTLPDFGGGGSRENYVAEFGGLFYAVAIWTNPSSPKLPQLEWLQLKRFAIAPDAPKNTASRFGGWMMRDVLKRFAEVTTLVSYQDCEEHDGTIYAAMGWKPGEIEERKGSGWSNRERGNVVDDKPKFVRRWTRILRR
jgi:hypothetical protein